MPTLTPPQDCQSMQDLRAQIDKLDRQLIELLVLRASYIDRASELKTTAGLWLSRVRTAGVLVLLGCQSQSTDSGPRL